MIFQLMDACFTDAGLCHKNYRRTSKLSNVCYFWKGLCLVLIKIESIILFTCFQGLDGLPGDKGDDGEAGQPVSAMEPKN